MANLSWVSSVRSGEMGNGTIFFIARLERVRQLAAPNVVGYSSRIVHFFFEVRRRLAERVRRPDFGALACARSGSFLPPVSRFHSSKVSLEILPSTSSWANFRRCAWLLNGTASLFLREPRRPLAELVDPFRGVCLREPVVERFAGLPAQCFEVGALRVGHRLVAGLPLVGVALELIRIRVAGLLHGAN